MALVWASLGVAAVGGTGALALCVAHRRAIRSHYAVPEEDTAGLTVDLGPDPLQGRRPAEGKQTRAAARAAERLREKNVRRLDPPTPLPRPAPDGLGFAEGGFIAPLPPAAPRRDPRELDALYGFDWAQDRHFHLGGPRPAYDDWANSKPVPKPSAPTPPASAPSSDPSTSTGSDT